MAEDEKELKDQRVVTMMSPSELESIDDWMFQNRIRSRGEAIRRLCQIGIAFEGSAVQMEEGLLHHFTALTRLAESIFKLLDKNRKGLDSSSVNGVLDALSLNFDRIQVVDDAASVAFSSAKPLRTMPETKRAIEEAREQKALVLEWLAKHRRMTLAADDKPDE